MKTVLAVDTYGERDPATQEERLVIKVLRSPVQVPDAERAMDFTYTAAGLPVFGSPSAVKERGRRLRTALIAHPGIALVLANLEATPVGQLKPIYVVLNGSSAELINWETLCDHTDRFVALDSRWPVGRMADPSTSPDRLPGKLELPVRVMLVISAFAIQRQDKEWDAFEQSLTVANKSAVPWKIKVLVGDSNLHQRIGDAIAAGLANVEVAFIDKTPSRLVTSIREWDPHILHFFCHGRSDVIDQALELATAGDYADASAKGGSVRLSKEHLGYIAQNLSNPWLLALNCCSGGQAASNLNSLAYDAVSVRFPAAVAMLEPVDAKDAHEFTSSFYSSLFQAFSNVATALKQANRVPFEWGQAMVDARTAIRDLHGDEGTSHEWAIPALYVRGVDGFFFEQAAPAQVTKELADTYRLKARIIADWLRTPGANQSEAEKQTVMQQVLGDVPEEYWPNSDGTFGNGG